MSRINKTAPGGITYLSEEEYEGFEFNKEIDYKKSRNVVKDINALVASEIILSTRRGFMMPYDLGILKIQKRVCKKNVEHPAFTKLQDPLMKYNMHSSGFIYKVYFIKKVAGVYVASDHRGRIPKRLISVFDRNYLYEYALHFDANRESINRPMAKLIISDTLPFVADIHELSTKIKLSGDYKEVILNKYKKFKENGPTKQ